MDDSIVFHIQKLTCIGLVLTTLKVESFAGRNIRDFASFLGVPESLYPRNRPFIGVRETLHEKSLKMASKKENLTKFCHVRKS